MINGPTEEWSLRDLPHYATHRVRTNRPLFHPPERQYSFQMPHNYEFNVTMTCSGCSNAVQKALGRLNGVTDTKVDLSSQVVNVTTAENVDYDTVYNAISKTGKKINEGKTIS